MPFKGLKKTKIPVVLASESPRRQEMLRHLGISFTVFVSGVEEILDSAESASQVAVRLAQAKASRYPRNDRLVISMDTIVAVGRRKLGKPVNKEEALEMLRTLSNRMHRVVTGVTLRFRNRTASDAEITRVYFRKIEPAEIQWYIDSGEPFDKAGAYAIQGLGRIFIDRIDGCYYNVIGFPIGCFQRLLHRLHLSIWDL